MFFVFINVYYKSIVVNVCDVQYVLCISIKYCKIIIVRWGPMFMAYVGNPCPRISITTNFYTISCLIFIKSIPITLPTKLSPNKQGKFWLTTNIDLYKLKWFHSYYAFFFLRNQIVIYRQGYNFEINIVYIHICDLTETQGLICRRAIIYSVQINNATQNVALILKVNLDLVFKKISNH